MLTLVQAALINNGLSKQKWFTFNLFNPLSTILSRMKNVCLMLIKLKILSCWGRFNKFPRKVTRIFTQDLFTQIRWKTSPHQSSNRIESIPPPETAPAEPGWNLKTISVKPQKQQWGNNAVIIRKINVIQINFTIATVNAKFSITTTKQGPYLGVESRQESSVIGLAI